MNFEHGSTRIRGNRCKGFSFLENSFRCGILQDAASVVEQHFVTSQYALVYISEGEGTYIDSDGKRWAIHSGDLFQRFPGVPHDVKLAPKTVRSYIAVPHDIYNLIERTENRFLKKPVHSLGPMYDLTDNFRHLMCSCEKEKDLYSLALKFQHLIKLCMLSADDYIKKEENSLEHRLLRAAELLTENLDEALSIQDVATAIGLNYHTFRRQFTRWADVSPGQFRIQKRIEKALSLLSNQKLSISEISALLGYSDIYAFSSHFKKAVGVSPRNFQKIVRS